MRQNIEVIAHRGASQAAPENTLAAFRLAWEEGADGIEGDFRLTRDGRVVVIHDATTARTAGVDLRVGEVTLEELKGVEVGSWKGEPWAGECVPTLEEVLEMVPPGKKIYLEIKGGLKTLVCVLESLGRSAVAPDQTVLLSFNARILKESKSRAPYRKTLWLVDRKEKNSAAGLLTAPGAGDPPAGLLLPRVGEVLATAREIRAEGVDVRAGHWLNTDFVESVRGAGLQLHVWTVNDLDTALRCRALGVDSITTDRPGWLRRALAASGRP